MTARMYVTFGPRYLDFDHPVDRRATPLGWFEYEANSYTTLMEGISNHLTPPGHRTAEYRLMYTYKPGNEYEFPKGCLARFGITDEGRVHDLEELAK